MSISGTQDLPFHVDGNSHKYVLSDQYRLLISPECEQDFVSAPDPNVVSCIWPLDHNGKIYNQAGEENFYYQLSQQHLKMFADHHVKILVVHPTNSSKIWWWHNNCKKVFYTSGMFDKKIKNRYADLPWLTTSDPVERAVVQMNYYQERSWYNALLQDFECADSGQLSQGQLRTVIAYSIANESFDYLTHWQKLPIQFPNMKFVSLDRLRDHTKQTIQDIFEYFDVTSTLPLDFIVEQWTALQTTRHRDAEHAEIVNCIVNGQHCDWSNLNFDLFDEVYLYYTLKFHHNIVLVVDHVDKLPTNTCDLLQLR